MLIQINTNMVATATDLILVYKFHSQMEACQKNLIIFGGDMNSFVHSNNKKKDILMLGEEPRQELDTTT